MTNFHSIVTSSWTSNGTASARRPRSVGSQYSQGWSASHNQLSFASVELIWGSISIEVLSTIQPDFFFVSCLFLASWLQRKGNLNRIPFCFFRPNARSPLRSFRPLSFSNGGGKHQTSLAVSTPTRSICHVMFLYGVDIIRCALELANRLASEWAALGGVATLSERTSPKRLPGGAFRKDTHRRRTFRLPTALFLRWSGSVAFVVIVVSIPSPRRKKPTGCYFCNRLGCKNLHNLSIEYADLGSFYGWRSKEN